MEKNSAGGRARFRIAADIWQVLSLYRWRIDAALLCLITAKVATVAVPQVLKRIIDAFADPGDLARLPLYLLTGWSMPASRWCSRPPRALPAARQQARLGRQEPAGR